MALLQGLLHLTNFNNPFLQTLVPSIAAAVAIQTAAGIPSVVVKTERFYDVSAALTYLSVTTLSLYLPALRARYATGLASEVALPSLLSPFRAVGGADGFNWRQVALSGAVAIWAIRCRYIPTYVTIPWRDHANLDRCAESKWVHICSAAS